MKSHVRSLLALVFAAASGTQALAQTDPLPSWNDGAAKQAIIEMVQATTVQSSPQFVPPEARIATFDQDGTLWVEHPIYTQLVYCLDRVPAVVRAKPELAKVEPFKTVLSGNRESVAKLSMDDLVKIAAATLTGMSVDEFQTEAKKWLDTARDPRWKRPYTELTYLPMIEVLKYLRANGYRTAVEFLAVVRHGHLMRSRRNHQVLVPPPIVVEFVHVADEVIHLFPVQQYRRFSLRLKFHHDQTVWSGNLVPVRL